MPAQIQPCYQAPTDIRPLNELAIRGLVPMFDAEKQLFCHRCKRTEHGLVREGHSHRYTIMTLLGLQRYETAGFRSPIPVKTTLESLLRDTSWIDNIGELGLLLWLCALTSPERLEVLYSALGVKGALNRYREVSQRPTMELAWFLTGLSEAGLALPAKRAELKDAATATYRLVKKNHGAHGFFAHSSRTGSLAGIVRGSIGSFADQVYPIYGMTKFAEAFGVDEALRSAMECAVAICKAQGPLGQWWWHYDSMTGRVVGRYPVYSVHQHGMGPMALFAVGHAARRDFDLPIYKGLGWVHENEMGASMEDRSLPIIWRCIQPASRVNFHLSRLLGALRMGTNSSRERDLAIVFECRPYELGWLLYAFAPRISGEAARS